LDIYYELKPGLIHRSALALGFFDGVHPGHQSVIKKAVEEARGGGSVPAVITFAEHPRTLTLGKSPPLLTLLDQRLDLFSQLGVAATLVLSFTEEICRLSPREYVEQVIVKAMGARTVSVGYNHRFGRNREGDPQLLARLGEEFGFTVHVCPPVSANGIEVSSSRIREALEAGDVELAWKLLARPYSIRAAVVRGAGRGRALGFPTANLAVAEEQILPGRGVYAGTTRFADGRCLPSVINLGYRPTVTDAAVFVAEVHVLDLDEDFYGRNLEVDFRHFLRAEQRFAGPAELKRQIESDCARARQLLSAGTGRPFPEGSLRA